MLVFTCNICVSPHLQPISIYCKSTLVAYQQLLQVYTYNAANLIYPNEILKFFTKYFRKKLRQTQLYSFSICR